MKQTSLSCPGCGRQLPAQRGPAGTSGSPATVLVTCPACGTRASVVPGAAGGSSQPTGPEVVDK